MYQDKITSWFQENRQNMIDDICRLIEIESVSGEPADGKPFGVGPARALECALSIAENMGFATKNYGCYVGVVDMNDLTHQLDILVHLDVVPAGGNWKVTNPFSPLVKDGNLYGRGSADDKGPAVAALYAMKAAKELGIPFKKNVRIVLGTDEECGGADIEHYYAVQPEAPMTFSPDAQFPVINIEKGRYCSSFSAKFSRNMDTPKIVRFDGGIGANIVPDAAAATVAGMDIEAVKAYCEAAQKESKVHFACRGQGDSVVIEARGKSAHAHIPDQGNNAVTALLELLSRMPFAPSEGFHKIQGIRAVFPHGDWRGTAAGIAQEDALSGVLTLSLDELCYTESELKGCFDCRTPVCATETGVRDPLREKMTALGIELANQRMTASHHVDEKSPLVQTLLKCYEQYTGRVGKCLAIGGGTYVHNLKNGVAFGCAMEGTDNHMHGDDEFAVIEDLVTSGEIFAQVILDLCT